MTLPPRFFALAALLIAGVFGAAPAAAAVMGINPPVLPLSAERVAVLPPEARAPWLAYLARSQSQAAADRAALAAERQGMSTLPPVPPSGHAAAKSMPLHQPAAWYGTAAAAGARTSRATGRRASKARPMWPTTAHRMKHSPATSISPQTSIGAMSAP